jgi:hypothetical protein
MKERFLAVQERRVGALTVLVALNLPRSQGQLDAAQERRMRVGLEVRVD